MALKVKCVAKEVSIAAVYATCGKCGDPLCSKGGSEMIDLMTDTPKGTELTCSYCHAVNTIPVRLYDVFNPSRD